MPNVEASIWINAPLVRVYEIAKDNAAYPEFIKDVQSVHVIEKEGNRVVADYVGVIPQFLLKVRWRQEEVWDDSTHSSRFRQIQGDYDRMEGTWSFAEEKGGVRFSQTFDYEYNVPTLGPLVKKVIHGIVIKNLDNIGTAIKQRAEGAKS